MTDPLFLRSLIALGALATTCGCSALDNCPDAQSDITIDRPEDSNAATLVFDSAGWNDKFDAFPAKTQLKFKHHLGVTPDVLQAYLSFSTKAANGIAGGSFTEVAGNEVAYECVDSNVIIVKNDTCERSFFIKVHASGRPDGSTDTSCGGGTNEPDGSGGATAAADETGGAAGAAGASNN